jgi:hypothetical protein
VIRAVLAEHYIGSTPTWKRVRGGVPRLRARRRPPSARGQLLDRPRRRRTSDPGRLRLARSAGNRRDRWPRYPRHVSGVRKRPAQRPAAHGGPVAAHACYLAAAPRRAGPRGGKRPVVTGAVARALGRRPASGRLSRPRVAPG